MELENLFENINLDYNYNSNENLQIFEEIIRTENINEMNKMCNYIINNFTIDENDKVYKDLGLNKKKKIKRIRDLINTILYLYSQDNNNIIIFGYFNELYLTMESLCFT